MRSVLLRSLVVIGAGGIVLAAVLYVASTVDARAPEVLEIRLTQPLADDAGRALITTSIEVVFSEPIDEDGVDGAVSIEPDVDGAVSWSGSTLILTPHDPLELETAYTVSVGRGIRDLVGNEMSELPPDFEFETAGRPTLVESSPADGASDVALDGPIGLTFSTLMDTASVESELRLRPSFAHELRWSGELLEIIPSEPLRPGSDYQVSVQAGAADAAGVAIGDAITIGFRTAAPGLAAQRLVPADGIDGIATTSPIAVIFDGPVDPSSVTGEMLTISPDVAGSLEVVALPDDPPAENGAGSILQFIPSGPLPANTTFDVELAPGVTATAGGGLTAPLSWSFTTGAPLGALSNQITFITDRSGVPNVWAMNPDGTRQRQVSVELVPVLDYAVASDGSSLVVADGRRLVYARADGIDRQVLTDDGVLEFDPTYAPGGDRIAFARADVETGEGLGLWEWEVGAGEATPIELPPELGDDPTPRPSGAGAAAALRHPRYSPDGQALAYVDLVGWIGILELPSERLTRVPFDSSLAPIWMPDSGSVVLTGSRSRGAASETTFEAPVGPMTPDPRDAIFTLSRSGTSIAASAFGAGVRAAAVDFEGSIAYLDGRGILWFALSANAVPTAPAITRERVAAAAFAPGEHAMVVILSSEGDSGVVTLLDIESGRRTELARNGSSPRWLP